MRLNALYESSESHEPKTIARRWRVTSEKWESKFGWENHWLCLSLFCKM